MIEQIRKEDIPDWEYGDVAIKTFSFGEKFDIANLKARTGKEGPEITNSEISIKDITLKSLAAGIHFVRTKENAQFIVRPGTSIKDREDFCYNTEFNSGQYLLKKVYEINKETPEAEIKNLLPQAEEAKKI